MNSEQRHSAESKLLIILKGFVNLFKSSISSANNINPIETSSYFNSHQYNPNAKVNRDNSYVGKMNHYRGLK